MLAGRIGCMHTPNQGNRLLRGVPCGWDNSRYGKHRPPLHRWRSWLAASVARYGTADCLFVTVPDEPFDHAETRKLWGRWRDTVAAFGVPVAFVAQEGSEGRGEIPWEDLDVLFLGGGDSWKDGAGGRRVADEAHDRGVPVHVGRVNSWRRYQHGVQILRARTCDGTTIARGPNKRLADVLMWDERAVVWSPAFDPREAMG